MPHAEPAHVAHMEPQDLAITAFLADAGRVFSAEDYGAVHDGETDDAASLRSAVDAAYAAGGGVVYLPAGTYFLHSGASTAYVYGSVPLKDNVSVYGAGIGVTNVVSDGGGVDVGANIFVASNSENISVRDLSAAFSPPRHCNGVKFSKCDNVSVADLRLEDTYIGIALYACNHAIVDSCYVRNTTSGFGYTFSEDEDNFAAVGFTDILVRNCVAENADNVGFGIEGSPGTPIIRASNVRLENCVATGSFSRGYRSRWCEDISFLNCRGADNEGGDFMCCGVLGLAATGCISDSAYHLDLHENGAYAYGVNEDVVFNGTDYTGTAGF